MKSLNSTIKEVKHKKELSDISDEVVRDALKNYLKKHNIELPSSPKSRKILIKEIRAELRKYVGRYQIKSEYEKRLKLLKSNQIPELLKTHTSTRERLPYYNALIRAINNLKPKSILDLGSGLNPIAIINKIKNKNLTYFAYDIKEDELQLINAFFRKNKIKGRTILTDIRKITTFPKTDLCLILKTLDIIETKGHTHATKIMRNLQSPNIIVSFSTRTLSGRPMRSPRRQWFESLLESLKYKYKVINSSNEVFYFIEKQLPR